MPIRQHYPGGSVLLGSIGVFFVKFLLRKREVMARCHSEVFRFAEGEVKFAQKQCRQAALLAQLLHLPARAFLGLAGVFRTPAIAPHRFP